MGYFIRTVVTGAVREIEKWKKTSKEARRQARRAAKANPTTAAQMKVNLDNALRRLRWAVNTNFGYGDYWVTLTYSREHEPTDESCEADYQKFLRQLRGLYKKMGITLKYIAVCNEKGRRPHIHILLKKGAALEEIQALWPFGRIGVKLLDASGQYRALAEYIFRHGEGRKGKRWNSSKNLIHPRPKEQQVNARSWRSEPTAPKGWRIDKGAGIERGVNPVTGAEYIRYSLIRVEKSREARPRAGAGATTIRN